MSSDGRLALGFKTSLIFSYSSSQKKCIILKHTIIRLFVLDAQAFSISLLSRQSKTHFEHIMKSIYQVKFLF